MEIGTIMKAIRGIRESVDDPESARGLEDKLHQDVLRSIAYGNCANPAQSARAALQSLEIDFPRWRA